MEHGRRAAIIVIPQSPGPSKKSRILDLMAIRHCYDSDQAVSVARERGVHIVHSTSVIAYARSHHQSAAAAGWARKQAVGNKFKLNLAFGVEYGQR